ncbi:PAS domain S-box protein [Legionella sp. km535]|uniref:PAS domain-containing protein n=1 Tax=Legionella sp. km535 TaxID=2498107 RepID=UPI000F8E9A65|nr:PAS domain S-box protein [Legionella sp. km535]RUR18343.1 PAS domain S-box protein [Legionella sp. km535]
MPSKMSQLTQHALLYQLITSEERYQNFMNASSDAIFVHDLNGVILDVNNEACISLGYSRQELINSFVWEIEIAITQETIKQNIIKLTYGPFNLEGLHRRKDGSTFPVDVRLSMFSTMGKQFVLAIVRDISEQKRAEATIKKLTRALDQSPLLIVITDKAGTIDYVNQQVIKRTGYNNHEIVGKNFLNFKSENAPLDTYQSILEHLTKENEWHGDLLIKNKKGELLKFTGVFSPLRDETNNQIIQYLIVIEEVPKKKNSK